MTNEDPKREVVLSSEFANSAESHRVGYIPLARGTLRAVGTPEELDELSRVLNIPVDARPYNYSNDGGNR